MHTVLSEHYGTLVVRADGCLDAGLLLIDYRRQVAEKQFFRFAIGSYHANRLGWRVQGVEHRP